MLELPDYNTLVEVYPNEISEELPKLFNGLEFLTNKVNKQAFSMAAENDDIDISADGFHASDARFIAVQLLVRDLKHYREQARNIIDNYKVRRFDLDTAIQRTNTLIGRLTGFRSFIEELHQTFLNDVQHARLDTRLEVLQEEIFTKMVRTASIEDDVDLSFDPTHGGIRR